MATFVGHDHGMTMWVDWKGVCCAMDGCTEGIIAYHDIPGGNGAQVIELTPRCALSRHGSVWEERLLMKPNYPF